MAHIKDVPVSVVVPVYRGLQYMPALTASLAVQGAAQVVVVVDGSHDFEKICEAFESVPGALVIATPMALGTAGARNFGAERVTQEWITFLDQDDSWPTDFLRTLMSRVSGVTAYDNDLYTFGASGDRLAIGETVFASAGWTDRTIGLASASKLLRGFPMVKLILPTDTFARIGGFRPKIYAVEDFDLVWRLVASEHEIVMEREPRGHYVKQVGSISAQIAAGNLQAATRAQRSWVRIWFDMAKHRALPLDVRVGAVLRAGRSLSRVGKLLVRQRLNGH